MKKLLLGLFFFFGILFQPKASCIIWYNCGTGVCGSYQQWMNCETWGGSSCVNVNGCSCQQLAPVISSGGGVEIAKLNDAQSILIYDGGVVTFFSNGREYVLFSINTYYPNSENNIAFKIAKFTQDELQIDLVEQYWINNEWESISTQSILKNLRTLKNLYPSPNPSQNIVFVTDNGKEIKSGDVSVVLYTQNMENSYNFTNIIENNYSFNVSSLNNGNYVYNIVLEGVVQFGGQLQIAH